ncbi:MAG: acyl-CoA/acyl-ACP dehydrogenase [Verrucomicrobiota bacterium]|nr:acyl-CoA/acyl-ACP dehydrogenase [Verrucomicrobiota bacterium]
MEDIKEERPVMKMLPGDEVRQIMWRYAERYDIQMAVAGARQTARSVVAQLVANGQRFTHEWTPEKQSLFDAFDASGMTAATLNFDCGGLFEGPRNLAMSLVTYETAWVDNGAATSSFVNDLAMGPIAELGTPEQKKKYMTLCAPGNPSGKTWRGSFALTEPLPYVGVDTGVLCGRISVAEWKDGEEPMLRVEKRGRFITNIAICDYITIALDSGDDRIKGSCMVVVEATDPGKFDRGAQTKKLVHQLSNTGDPVIDVVVPASRIIGGYSVKDGMIVPNLSHSEIIAQVFSKTRVGVGVMGAASLMSAVEPVIRYQRTRFRGAAGVAEESPRYKLGLQMKEDVTQRLADVWATAEAASSLGFDISRVYDRIEAIQDEARERLGKGRAMLKAMKAPMERAVALLAEGRSPEEDEDVTVRYVYLQAIANVLCPSCKLWNTGHGADMMRQAISLMGGYGITEDCPGFLFYKWTDMQLDATYEGPEAVQRRQISETMGNAVFLAQLEAWAKECDECPAAANNGMHALAAALRLWMWTRAFAVSAKDASGKKLGASQRHGVVFPLADALAGLMAAKSLHADVKHLAINGKDHPVVGPELDGYLNTFNDLLGTVAGNVAGEAARICAEVAYGFGAATAEQRAEFAALRARVDESLAGTKTAKDGAAKCLTTVMIPEALDYPM